MGIPITGGLNGLLTQSSLWLLPLLFCLLGRPALPEHISSFGDLYHTAWGIRDGVPPNITDLAQTTDGYLWLATQGGGLYRFDGVRFEQFNPTSGAAILSDIITALLAQPDGSLWIGYLNGGASLLRGGRVTNFGVNEGLGARVVSMFARDPSGSVWAATALGLKRFDGFRWNHIGTDWNYPFSYAERVYVDSGGTLWVSSGTTLMFLRRGEKRFHATGLHFRDLVAMSRAQDGTLWTSGIGGLVTPYFLSPEGTLSKGSSFALRSIAISIDRDGMLWVPTTSNGVWRLPVPRLSSLHGRTVAVSSDDQFTHSDGLTANEGVQVLEDAEGDVWVATSGGLDRFRRAKLDAVPLPSGARGVVVTPADPAGILVSTGAVSPGLMWVTRQGTEPIEGAPASLSCAYRDGKGTVWLGGINTLWKFSNRRFLRVPLPEDIPPFREVQAITEDRAGDIWIALTLGELYRLKDGRWTKPGSIAGLPNATPLVAYTDSLGRVWFGYERNRLAVLVGRRLRTFSTEQGLSVGDVTAISERSGDVWVGGTSGLQRLDGGRFHALTTTRGDLKNISGIVQRSNGELWLNQKSGIVRIGREEISKFKHNADYQVQFDVFDALDGMPGAAYPTSRLPSAIESSDGMLWFSTSSGLAWIDPDHIQTNHVMPTVLIQSVMADDKMHRGSEQIALPNRIQNLIFNYTALSLSMPERVRFRYMLEGFDKDWQQAGTRRQAFYSQLHPGHYRFRVVACNNDGVWNATGASYEFSVAPAFYQTSWFRVLSAIAAVLILRSLYLYRLRQLGRQLQVRYDERLAERTRIARELHDTLLQSFHGLILRFQAVQNMLPGRPLEAMQSLEIAIDRAAEAITEGRDAVQKLRRSQMVNNDLIEMLISVGRELEAENSNAVSPAVPAKIRVVVEGTARPVHPTVQDNLYRIAREAMSNALSHAQAGLIEVEIRYGRRMLRLRIRDDGRGMDPGLVLEGGRAGHWGLPGMRERTRSIGGHFELWSEIRQGTEIEVTIPGVIAYRPPGDTSARLLVGKGDV